MRAIELAVMALARARRGAVRGAAAGAPHPRAEEPRRPSPPQRPAPPRLQARGARAALPDTSMPTVPSQTAKMIDMAQVQGQVHAQSIQKVGELAERNPHETVAIVRQWLQDAPA